MNEKTSMERDDHALIEALKAELATSKARVAELEAKVGTLNRERGAEAEALRVAFELLSEQDEVSGEQIMDVLDRIDAVDALAYLESQDRRVCELETEVRQLRVLNLWKNITGKFTMTAEDAKRLKKQPKSVIVDELMTAQCRCEAVENRCLLAMGGACGYIDDPEAEAVGEFALEIVSILQGTSTATGENNG